MRTINPERIYMIDPAQPAGTVTTLTTNLGSELLIRHFVGEFFLKGAGNLVEVQTGRRGGKNLPIGLVPVDRDFCHRGSKKASRHTGVHEDFFCTTSCSWGLCGKTFPVDIGIAILDQTVSLDL
jgi:hypothetical protein